MQLSEINSSNVEKRPLASSRCDREPQLLAALFPRPMAQTIRSLHDLCPLHLITHLSVHNLVASPSTSALAVCDSPVVLIMVLALVTIVVDAGLKKSVEGAAVEIKHFYFPSLVGGASHRKQPCDKYWWKKKHMHMLAAVRACVQAQSWQGRLSPRPHISC